MVIFTLSMGEWIAGDIAKFSIIIMKVLGSGLI
jgi:hypothetical protein